MENLSWKIQADFIPILPSKQQKEAQASHQLKFYIIIKPKPLRSSGCSKPQLRLIFFIYFFFKVFSASLHNLTQVPMLSQTFHFPEVCDRAEASLALETHIYWTLKLYQFQPYPLSHPSKLPLLASSP